LQKGVEPEIRYDVWKYLLDYIPYSCTQIEAVELRNKKIQEYHTLCQQWRSMTLEQEERFSQFKDRKSLISMYSVTVFVPEKCLIETNFSERREPNGQKLRIFCGRGQPAFRHLEQHPHELHDVQL
jgi:hypothetical protein